MNARARQWRNNALYSALNQASGLPYLDMPEPVMTGESSPVAKGKNKKLWILLLAIVAYLLFGKAFKGSKKR